MSTDSDGNLSDDVLAKHLDKKIRIFISDKAIVTQLQNFLLALKFTNVEVTRKSVV